MRFSIAMITPMPITVLPIISDTVGTSAKIKNATIVAVMVINCEDKLVSVAVKYRKAKL